MITFTIPRELIINANHRLHYRVEARFVHNLRALAYWRTVSQRRDFTPIVDKHLVTATFTYQGGRRPSDPANLHPTVKPLIDGMVDAGWAPDDNRRYVEGPLVKINEQYDRMIPAGHVRVRIEWEPAA